MAGYRTPPFFLGPDEVCQSAIQSDDSVKIYRGNRQRRVDLQFYKCYLCEFYADRKIQSG